MGARAFGNALGSSLASQNTSTSIFSDQEVAQRREDINDHYRASSQLFEYTTRNQVLREAGQHSVNDWGVDIEIPNSVSYGDGEDMTFGMGSESPTSYRYIVDGPPADLPSQFSSP